MFISSKKLRETIPYIQNSDKGICFTDDVYMAIENREKDLNSILPNIYTILDKIKFEELCKKKNLDRDKVFSIIQNFYDILIDIE